MAVRTLAAVTVVSGLAAAAVSPAHAKAPELLGQFTDWSAYTAVIGRDTVCFALAQPQRRAPEGLNRDPAYFFVKRQGGQPEVSIELGFPVKDAPQTYIAIDQTRFALMTQGGHAWSSDNADGQIVQAMRGGREMTVRTTSARGNVTTDTYSLMGVSAALDRVQRCK